MLTIDLLSDCVHVSVNVLSVDGFRCLCKGITVVVHKEMRCYRLVEVPEWRGRIAVVFGHLDYGRREDTIKMAGLVDVGGVYYVLMRSIWVRDRHIGLVENSLTRGN